MRLLGQSRANVVPVFLHAGMSSGAGNMRTRFFVDLGYSLFWIDDMSGTEGRGPSIGMGLGHEFRAAAEGGRYGALRWRIQPSQAYHERSGTDGMYHHSLSLVVGLPIR